MNQPVLETSMEAYQDIPLASEEERAAGIKAKFLAFKRPQTHFEHQEQKRREGAARAAAAAIASQDIQIGQA